MKHEQVRLFCEFELDEVVPDDHLVREIAAALDLCWVRGEPFFCGCDPPTNGAARMTAEPDRRKIWHRWWLIASNA